METLENWLESEKSLQKSSEIWPIFQKTVVEIKWITQMQACDLCTYGKADTIDWIGQLKHGSWNGMWPNGPLRDWFRFFLGVWPEQLLLWSSPNISKHIQTVQVREHSSSLQQKVSFSPRTEQFSDIFTSIANVCSCGRTPRGKTKAKK